MILNTTISFAGHRPTVAVYDNLCRCESYSAFAHSGKVLPAVDTNPVCAGRLLPALIRRGVAAGRKINKKFLTGEQETICPENGWFHFYGLVPCAVHSENGALCVMTQEQYDLAKCGNVVFGRLLTCSERDGEVLVSRSERVFLDAFGVVVVIGDVIDENNYKYSIMVRGVDYPETIEYNLPYSEL